jgi:hypothetical protein
MSYTIAIRPNESIIWETWEADFDAEIDAEAATREELRILNAASRPIVLVVDMRLVQLDWNAILYIASHGIPEELNNHPQLRRIVIITTDEVIADSARGLDNEVFGFVKVDIVTSPQEALTRARKLLL